MVPVLLLLASCSSEDKYQLSHWAMPDVDATAQSPHIYALWKWSWIALLIVGVITWALMFWAAWAYRRRSDDDIPIQTRYNLPLEVFYTIAPLIMVIVLFNQTVKTQNEILAEVDNPDRTIFVVGQQWSWTFNHYDEAAGKNYYTVGNAGDIPTLVLPVGETVDFQLRSPDVIHSFWVTGFLMKMDVIPGQENNFQVTPTKEGTYRGKCAELCGVYHSRMLFDVEVVSPEAYEAYLAGLEELGDVSDEPLLGQEYTREQVGLEAETGGTE